MGLFDRLFSPSESPSAALSREVHDLREEVQTMRLEWDALSQRLQKWISRENARKRAAVAQEIGDPIPDATGDPNDLPASPQARKQALRARVATLHR